MKGKSQVSQRPLPKKRPNGSPCMVLDKKRQGKGKGHVPRRKLSQFRTRLEAHGISEPQSLSLKISATCLLDCVLCLGKDNARHHGIFQPLLLSGSLESKIEDSDPWGER